MLSIKLTFVGIIIFNNVQVIQSRKYAIPLPSSYVPNQDGGMSYYDLITIVLLLYSRNQESKRTF